MCLSNTLIATVARRALWLVLAFVPMLPNAALAADGAPELSDLKSAGIVGERADGYLGLVEEAAGDAAVALISEINAKRKAEYQRIAVANELSLDRVEALAGKKTLSKTSAGHWIFVESWRRK